MSIINANSVFSNGLTPTGNTPLHMAFKSGNYGLVINFLQNNADLNSVNDDGITPIGLANEPLLKHLNLSDKIAMVIKIKRNTLSRLLIGNTL